MKLFVILFALFALPLSSFAAVQFEGGNWAWGRADAESLKVIGISTDEDGTTKVVLNLASGRRVILTDSHVAVGLSLTPFQGQCIKIMPGKAFKSVAFILTCDNQK